jgi:hypothetical protein
MDAAPGRKVGSSSGGRRKTVAMAPRDREALLRRWGEKMYKVEEEAYNVFSSLDRWGGGSRAAEGNPGIFLFREDS